LGQKEKAIVQFLQTAPSYLRQTRNRYQVFWKLLQKEEMPMWQKMQEAANFDRAYRRVRSEFSFLVIENEEKKDCFQEVYRQVLAK
jgi:hypothetical protein